MDKKLAVKAILFAFLTAAVWQWMNVASRCRKQQDALRPPLSEEVRAAQWPAFKNGGALRSSTVAFPFGRMKKRWEKKLPGESETGPVAAHGRVYAAAGPVLYALDMASGAERWAFTGAADFSSTPLYLRGCVCIGDVSGVFHAVDAGTGKKKWDFKTKGEIRSSANWALSAAGASVLFGSYDHAVYCLDADSGRELWKFETGAQVHAAVAVDGGSVYCGGCDQNLRAIDLQSGTEKWKTDLGAPLAASPVCAEGFVFAATLTGETVCVQAGSGEVKWRHKSEREVYKASPAAAYGIVAWPGENGSLRVTETQTGQVRHIFHVRAGFEASPAIAGDTLFVPGKDGVLHAVGLRSGVELWSFEIGTQLTTSPALAEGCCVLCDKQGTVFCLTAGPE